MKKIVLRSLITFKVLLFVLAGFPANAQDGEPKVSVNVNYIGGPLKTRFDYPNEKFGTVSGKVHDQEGVDLDATIVFNPRVNFTYRGQLNIGRRSQFYDSNNQDQTERYSPDDNQRGGDVLYNELGLTVKLPAHLRLIVGATYFTFNQAWRGSYTMEFTPVPSTNKVPIVQQPPQVVNYQSHHNERFIGPVTGISFEKTVGPTRINIAGRVYPHLARSERGYGSDSVGGKYANPTETLNSYGFEIRGVVSYPLGNKIDLNGGYQFRQVSTPKMGSVEWPVNGRLRQSGLIAGLGFRF